MAYPDLASQPRSANFDSSTWAATRDRARAAIERAGLVRKEIQHARVARIEALVVSAQRADAEQRLIELETAASVVSGWHPFLSQHVRSHRCRSGRCRQPHPKKARD
jgi:hypothetical protein